MRRAINQRAQAISILQEKLKRMPGKEEVTAFLENKRRLQHDDNGNYHLVMPSVNQMNNRV